MLVHKVMHGSIEDEDIPVVGCYHLDVCHTCVCESFNLGKLFGM